MDKNKVKNLNKITIKGRVGIYKQSLLKDKNSFPYLCDCLEKINFALQDIKKELEKEPDNTVLISILVFVGWIQESIDQIKKLYKDSALNNFVYNEKEISDNKEYFNAIRSFIFAHPYTTNRHSKYGFDGTLRCGDIRPVGKDNVIKNNQDKFYIDSNGLIPYNKQPISYWLYIYNDKKYNNQFNQYIGISISTICNIANDYVDYLYALDKHLKKIKTK